MQSLKIEVKDLNYSFDNQRNDKLVCMRREHVNEQLTHMRENVRELHTKLASSSLIGAGCHSHVPSQSYELIISLFITYFNPVKPTTRCLPVSDRFFSG